MENQHGGPAAAGRGAAAGSFGGGRSTAHPWQPVPEQLPTAAWVLAASCLVGQLLQLAEAGTTPATAGWLPSMLLGALLVGWVSAGVLAARTGRLVIVWALFVLMFLADAVAAWNTGAPGLLGWPGADLLTSVAQLASLAWFTTTSYYYWQRTRPRVPGPSRAPLIAVAVLVGLLGGVIDTVDSDSPVRVHFGDSS